MTNRRLCNITLLIAAAVASSDPTPAQFAAGHFVLGIYNLGDAPCTAVAGAGTPRLVEFDCLGNHVNTFDLSSAFTPPDLPGCGDAALRPCRLMPSGNILCTTGYMPGGGWLEVNSSGVATDYYPDTEGSAWTGSSGPNHAALGPGGQIYGTHYNPYTPGKIEIFNPGSSALAGSFPSDQPVAIEFIGTTLYVGRHSGGGIDAFSTPSGTLVAAWPTPPATFGSIFYLRATPAGKLVMADPTGWSIFDPGSGSKQPLMVPTYAYPPDACDVDQQTGEVYVVEGTTIYVFAPGATTHSQTIALNASSLPEFAAGSHFWGLVRTAGVCTTPQFTLTLAQPAGIGSINIALTNGGASEPYFTALTFNLANYAPPLGVGLGSGWWFGLWISQAEVFTQAGYPPPFRGSLSAGGTALFTLPANTIPSWLSSFHVFGVSVTFSAATGMLTGTSNLSDYTLL